MGHWSNRALILKGIDLYGVSSYRVILPRNFIPETFLGAVFIPVALHSWGIHPTRHSSHWAESHELGYFTYINRIGYVSSISFTMQCIQLLNCLCVFSDADESEHPSIKEKSSWEISIEFILKKHSLSTQAGRWPNYENNFVLEISFFLNLY